MGPFDYTLQVQQPFQTALQGYQVGAAIRDDQAKQAALEAQRQAQVQMQTDLTALSRNRSATAQDYASMMTRYPQLSEQLKRASDSLTGTQQQAFLQENAPILAALQQQKPEVAERLVRERADAMRNSGMDEQAKQADVLAETIRLHPDIARSSVALRISALPGGDKVIDSVSKLGAEDRAAAQAPAELAKKEADAKKAQVDAKYAESTAIADLKKKDWDITKIQADIDIAKQTNRIAAMNAATARANSDTERQALALKVKEAQQKLDTSIREKAAEAEGGAASIDNMLNTIERVKKNKGLNSVIGSIEGGKFYPQTLAGMLPGTVGADERADAIALIETLGSQAFVAQIPSIKGTGALSDAEGKKLQSALQSLSREQSEAQFRANLDEASRLLTKSRETLSRRTGVPLGKPDTPAAPGARPPLDSFFKP